MPAWRQGQSVIRLIATAAVLLGLAGGGAWLYLRYSRSAVLVTRVVQAPIRQAFYATGTLAPDRDFPVKSNVDGILTQVLVDKGDRVRRGQTLAFVNAEDLQLRFRQAQAEAQLKRKLASESTSPVMAEFTARITAAQEIMESAKRELERMTQMHQNGAATQGDLDRAGDRVQTAWSALESLKSQKATRKLELERDRQVAEAALDIAQWFLDQQTIKGPIEGVVLDRPVSAGTRVRINDQILVVAEVAPGKLVMRAAVDEEDKTRLREGKPGEPAQEVQLTLYSYPGRLFRGRVAKVYPKADPNRRTFEVDVTVEPFDPGFSAGMTGELAFIVRAKDQALVAPSQAVVSVESDGPTTSASEAPDPGAGDYGSALDGQGLVWLVEGGRLVRRHVSLGLRSIERTEIVAGLAEGDQVVVSPSAGLREGQVVRVRYVEPEAAAGLNRKADDSAFRGFN